ncbi:MBL fold metallo-hydrolase [Paenibacillus pasadenensis]|uniref:MBL fold metallo-hydrolase n=1 Tax=Paenibacillus pasadenensis TaxID=217090 RepID=UPI00048EC5B1|nr:MBL fold metallo-hydrolase [Paenibacillus pasadenensis]
MGVWIGIAAALAAALTLAYLYIRPALGGKPSPESRERIRRSKQYRDGVFAYPLPTPMLSGWKDQVSILGEFLKGTPQAVPDRPLDVERYSPASAAERENAVRVTWFGHSAVLLELGDMTVFLDPMLGRAPSPVPMIGGQRFKGSSPVDLERLPRLDAVVLSHDHYDHLDYPTILRLKEKTGMFIVPLGVAAHLERWGVAREAIRECDWSEAVKLNGLTLTCAAARHFSGRGLLSRNSTLWCSWVIEGQGRRIFFSGDSGYGPHFREIGETYGPFDLTLMECGQYDRRWASIHMLPEETVQAHRDVRGSLLLPIHWGAFRLALHAWTDPVERLLRAASVDGVAVCTPRIGETVTLGKAEPPATPWWR